MDDLPDNVPDLQARLVKARQEYAKLANRFAREQSMRTQAQTQMAEVLRIARDGIWPEEPPAQGSELYIIVSDLFWDAQKASHPRAAAERRLDLLQRLSSFWPSDLGEAMQQVVNTAIGKREEWARLLAEVRAELKQARE